MIEQERNPRPVLNRAAEKAPNDEKLTVLDAASDSGQPKEENAAAEEGAAAAEAVNEDEGEASDAQPEKEKSQVPEEDPVTDQHLIDFLAKSEEEKDQMTCDEVFCIYLREISKRVNESYYK